MNEFTGERVIPGQVEIDLWNEHLARYAFASRFVAGARVLDAGCGSGYGAAELSVSARSVTGVDLSHGAAGYARDNFRLENLQFVAASASALPFAGASFDVVVAYEVIEHLADWDCLLEEAARVLTPKGLFIVSTPNTKYYAESRGARGENPYHAHEFEAEEFDAALSKVFPNVEFLLQNRSEAFVFYPRKSYRNNIEARLDSSGGTATEAHFFVAVCSRQPVEFPAFVYVPRAANVLGEREQHIRKLQNELALNQGWLAGAREERAQLLIALEQQKEHLEEQNRWGLGLEREWKAAQQRIVELQNEFNASTEAYQSRVAGLENEVEVRTEWAQDTERRLSIEIEHLRNQVADVLRVLHTTEATVEERSRWALDLQGKLDRAEAQIAAARASRWVRTGRMFGLGPEF